MNKTRKILFFDIDGTLITDDGKRYFPDSAKEAIQKARENGHLAFMVLSVAAELILCIMVRHCFITLRHMMSAQV